jgi:hypothetical protein
MFNTAILDVAMGMVFVYLLLSLMSSAANELIELWLKNRATDLERGLRELLNDPNGDGLVQKIYNHPLISGLFAGQYESAAVSMQKRMMGRVTLPSYIPARTFALALMDTILPGQAAVAGGTTDATPAIRTATPPAGGVPNPLQTLRDNISTIGDPRVEQALRALVDAAGSDVARARENIENWFNASMDRVSGWYKRRCQVTLLIVGLFVTIGVNADSVLIAKRLSADKSLRESLVAAAEDYAKVNAEAAGKSEAESKAQPSPSATPVVPPAKPRTASSPSATPADSPSATPTATNTPVASPTPSRSPTTASLKPLPLPTPPSCAKNANSPQCMYDENLEEIKSLALPIGWESAVDGQRWPGFHFWTGAFWTGWYTQFRAHILGWLLTALAISLGAPFWFDLLNKFVVVRSTIKPHEKSGEEGSKD